MEITRIEPVNKLVGESLATASFELNEAKIEAPTYALNSQELWAKLEIEKEYRFTIKDKYDVFNADPSFDIRRLNSITLSKKNIQSQINYIDNIYEKASAKTGLYIPSFSSNITVPLGTRIKFIKKVSMESKNYPITLLEAPSFASTQKLIEKTKEEMRKERIEKDLFLMLNMKQEEFLYNQKLTFGGNNVSGIISEWGDPQLTWGNFLALASASSYKNLLRVMVNVPLKHNFGAIAPTGLLFADVISHVRVSGGSDKDKPAPTKEEIISKSILNTRRHYADENGLYTKSEYSDKNLQQHGCDCSIDEFAGETIQDVYAELNDHLYAASKVHNAKSIAQEIANCKPYIQKGTLKNFYRMKPNTIDVLENLLGIDTKGKQTKITIPNPN